MGIVVGQELACHPPLAAQAVVAIQGQPADAKGPGRLGLVGGQGGGPNLHLIAELLGRAGHFGGIDRDAAPMRGKFMGHQQQVPVRLAGGGMGEGSLHLPGNE